MSLPDFYLDFMKPGVWDGLVLASILIGTSLAILRIISDRAAYQDKQQRQRDQSPGDTD